MHSSHASVTPIRTSEAISLYFTSIIVGGHKNRRRVYGQKKTPGPRPEVRPKRIATDSPTGGLLVMALERGGALVELVELEAAGERRLAVVLEEVVGLLVVEDGAGT